MVVKNLIQAQQFQLAGSGCSASATSITLKSFTDAYGEDIVSASLNTTNYGTLEPGTDREEIISFTGITNNADGTVVLTGVTRGLLAVTPFTADSSLQKSHAGSTIFVLTNNPQIYKAIFDYIDGIAIAGAPNASTTLQGLVEEATQAEIDAGTAAGTLAQLFINPSKLRAKAYHDYAVDAVGTDAYAITITPAITAYASGQVFVFKVATANTGACSLAVSGLAAKTIKKNVSSDLATGDILAGQIVIVVYDSVTDTMKLVSTESGLKDATQLTGVLPTANGGTGRATSLYKTGSVALTNSNGTQNIAHGLGFIPLHIKITCTGDSTGNYATFSIGTYDGTSTNMIHINGVTPSTSERDTTSILHLSNSSSQVSSTVTFDSTNIILTTSVSNGGLAGDILWEAWGI